MSSDHYWFNRVWKKHQFKIIVITSIIIICVAWYFNDDSEGTYSTSYHYIPENKVRAFPVESKGEAECRRVLEKIFRRPFPNRRPLFLMNAVTKKPLEIDCCNVDLKLGVEYNGIQHYQYTPAFHKNYDAFRNQQYRDEMKHRLCEENNFNLIIVPYNIPIKDIELFLLNELRILKYI